jgi:hypothetical protein
MCGIDDIDDDELMMCGENDDIIFGNKSLTKKKNSNQAVLAYGQKKKLS